MTFSDDDLKRLKDLIAADSSMGGTRYFGILELICRLEAAEAVLLEIERFNNGVLADTSEFREWRKAAGK